MPPAIAHLEADWAAQFPGTSLLIVVLRSALAFADWHARQIEPQFRQLQEDLRLTGLPMHLWDRYTRQTYRFMERAHIRSQREFRRSLRALQSSYKKPETVKPPPPKAPASSPALTAKTAASAASGTSAPDVPRNFASNFLS